MLGIMPSSYSCFQNPQRWSAPKEAAGPTKVGLSRYTTSWPGVTGAHGAGPVGTPVLAKDVQ